MKRFLGYNPDTGISTYHEYDASSQKTLIHEVQDVERLLKRNKALANDSTYKRDGIKSDWYHFATVPMTVLAEIKRKYGFDWMAKDDLKHIEKVLKQEYKKLLTVDKI